ncbi:hypothetical protein PSTT_01829, partial [Puccinia striiformis]
SFLAIARVIALQEQVAGLSALSTQITSQASKVFFFVFCPYYFSGKRVKVMTFDMNSIRIPMKFIFFFFLLNMITSAITTSSGVAHHHAGTARSKVRRGNCSTRKRSAGPPLSETISGKGTHWNANWGTGNCVFSKWPKPRGYGAVAMSSNHWKEAQVCGACLEVTGPGGTFKGVVSDQCPSCKDDGIDLDTDIWYQVSGNKDFGIIEVKWKIVPCEWSTPLLFMNKIGVSQYFTSIQVQGANTPLKSLEVSTNGGSSWIPLKLQGNSNYYQPNGGGLGAKADVRVTCSSGKQFVTKDVDLTTVESPKPGSENC